MNICEQMCTILVFVGLQTLAKIVTLYTQLKLAMLVLEALDMGSLVSSWPPMHLSQRPASIYMYIQINPSSQRHSTQN